MLSVLAAVNVQRGVRPHVYRFERVVLDHAEREEQEEFPPVRVRESQSTLVEWARCCEPRKDRADPPASLDCGLADRAVDGGPWASAIDRARDAIGRHAAKLTS